METSVLIRIPFEYEKNYINLEERTDIDYAIMPVDNFSVGDFLTIVYITIETNPVATGVFSAMIWDTIKLIANDILKNLPKIKHNEPPLKKSSDYNTCIKISVNIKEKQKDECKVDIEYNVNKNLKDNDIKEMSINIADKIKEMVKLHYEKT